MDSLRQELLIWVASRERTYSEAMEAWRSNCPRHPVWDDALLEGLIEVDNAASMDAARVKLTARGKAMLAGAPKAPAAALR